MLVANQHPQCQRHCIPLRHAHREPYALTQRYPQRECLGPSGALIIWAFIV